MPVQPAGWGAAQAAFYAETIAGSTYTAALLPRLGPAPASLCDIGAGSGLIAGQWLPSGTPWQAVEPEPFMQTLLSEVAHARQLRLQLHPCIWQNLPAEVSADTVLAANVGATHHEALRFFQAMQGRWRREMVWVVAAQDGPSTFCLAGFLPPELHGADTQPAVQRTLAELGIAHAPQSVDFVDWQYRASFSSLEAAQAHFLDRLQLPQGGDRAQAVSNFVAQHAKPLAGAWQLTCQKRSAVLRWTHP
jgi:hypothetical protein